MTDTMPTLGTIRMTRGVAGSVAYTVPITYPGEPAASVTFTGSVYGGPVVMITVGNPAGTVVTDPDSRYPVPLRTGREPRAYGRSGITGTWVPVGRCEAPRSAHVAPRSAVADRASDTGRKCYPDVWSGRPTRAMHDKLV